MKFFVFLFVLVVSMEIAIADDSLTFENCEALGIEKCDEFRQLDISIEEQKHLFSSLLGIKSNMNIHDFIFNWNTHLNFNTIPSALLPENFKTVENAWLAITGIMPSVLYGEDLYINTSGYVQTNYGYSLTRPQTYFNGAWDTCSNNPPTSSNEGEGGDCKTEYPQNWDVSFLNVYRNDNLIGNSTLVRFNTSQSNNNFRSELNIVNKIQRDHFRWQQGNCCSCRRCCWITGRRTRTCGNDCGRCGCETFSQHCSFSGTDFRYDSLTLQDSKSSLIEEISYSRPSILYDAAKSTAYFIFNSTNIDNYELEIKKYNLVKRNLNYIYNYTYLPINVLTAKANYSPRIDANIFSTLEEKENSDLISFVFENDENYECKLTIHSFFNSFNLTCNITILPKTELNITTDKFFYMPNETIEANITIKSQVNASNDTIKLRYGNFTANVTGNSTLEIPAQVNVNQISAEYKTDLTKQSASDVRTISVYSGENPAYYVNVFWFTLGFLSFVSALRICWIKFAGAEK